MTPQRTYHRPDISNLAAERASGAGWLWLAWVIVIAALALVTPAQASDYYRLGAYHALWPRSSESDGIESSRLYGVAIEGAAGWHIAEQWRGEVALTVRGHEVHGVNPPGEALSADGNTLYAASLHVNAARDLVTWGRWTPYAFAGLGITAGAIRYTQHSWRDDSGRDLDYWFVVPSGQLGAGVSYAMSDGMALDISARYVRPMAVELDYRGDDVDLIADAWLIGVGVRW